MRTSSIAFTGLLLASSLQAADWGKNSTWNDKRAEVAVYESEILKDKQPQKFQETITTIRESASDSANGKNSFRQNIVYSRDHSNYPIQLLTSVVVDAESPTLVVSASLHAVDWSGYSSRIYQADASRQSGTFYIHSDQAKSQDRSIAWSLSPQDYFEDQLPLSLRSLPFKVGFSQKIRVWDSFVISSTTVPEPKEGVLLVEKEETVYCHAGGIPCWKVTVEHGKKIDSYWFDKRSPNILVRMEKADGHKRLLYGQSRWKYWDPRLPRPQVLN